MIDPRTPVIVGAGQVRQKPEDPREAKEPLATMLEAAIRAADDTGRACVAERARLIVTVDGAWRYPDPARHVARALGAGDATTALTAAGGHMPMYALNLLCRRVRSGALDCAILLGAEGVWSRRRMRAAGYERVVTDQGDVQPDEHIGQMLPLSGEYERTSGITDPIHAYPLFESALRARNGESIDANATAISTLWSRFSRVAEHNPHAWSHTPHSPDDIKTATPQNRMVCSPYTKLLTSNWDVDLAGALIVCSAELADAKGVPRDRWVFPLAGVGVSDTHRISERSDLGASAALAAAGRTLYAATGVGPDAIALVDLYSCFPSAVRIARDSLGLGTRDDLSLTGGMTFAGGPLNSYVLHSLARAVGLLREADRPDPALITANGGYLTKHQLGLFATRPPTGGYTWSSARGFDPEATRTHVQEDYVGEATIEAYTVVHDREGPRYAIMGCRTRDGGRAWATSTQRDLMRSLSAEEYVGRGVRLEATGEAAGVAEII